MSSLSKTKTIMITEEQVYAMAKEAYGIVPPLVKQMTTVSPEVGYHYVAGLHAVANGQFTDIEQHAIQLKISVLNRCESCIKGHSFLLKNAGVSNDDINAIRHGLLTSMKSVNRLTDLTEVMFLGGRETFTDERLEKLESAGANHTELFQIVSLIASKTISNYINNYLAAVKNKALIN